MYEAAQRAPIATQTWTHCDGWIVCGHCFVRLHRGALVQATPTPIPYIGRSEPLPSGSAAADAGQKAPTASDFGQHILLGATPAVDWSKLFESHPLAEQIRRAGSNNHTLSAARATLFEAQELVAAQSGARYPHVSLNAGAGRQKCGKQFLGPLSVPPFSYLAVGATVRNTLDYTGGIMPAHGKRGQFVAAFNVASIQWSRPYRPAAATNRWRL